MGQTDRYLSTLARRIWPYISVLVREMIGDMSVGGTGGDITWIQGTPIPEEDALSRGGNAIDLQISRDADTEIASGLESAILWGSSNKASGVRSAAGGYGAYAVDQGQFAIGHSLKDTPHGDAQGSRFIDTGNAYPDTTWTTFSDFTVRTDTAWTFLALIIGIESGAARTYSYMINGCVENDGGTISILAQTVTTIHEDDANYDVRAAVDDPNDMLDFQFYDSGDNSRKCQWTVHMLTAEATHA